MCPWIPTRSGILLELVYLCSTHVYEFQLISPPTFLLTPFISSLLLLSSPNYHNMNSPKATPRRQYFSEEDGGLASIADIEAGICINHNGPFVSRRPIQHQRKNSLRNESLGPFLGSSRSFRTTMKSYESRQPHFLDSCFLCKKTLARNRDIFMYRGDKPFCSEECRQEQIDMDEAKEKSWNQKSFRKKETRISSTSNKTPKDCTLRTRTVVAT